MNFKFTTLAPGAGFERGLGIGHARRSTKGSEAGARLTRAAADFALFGICFLG